MGSKKRNLYYQSVHHIYNRGVLKKDIFHCEGDYKRFVGRILKYMKRYPVEIQAFCVLPNHFHFLACERGQSSPNIPRFMQQLQCSYAKYYAKKYDFSGRLFQGTYKSKLIEGETHYESVFLYIQENPVKHGLVKDSKLWKFRGPHL